MRFRTGFFNFTAAFHFFIPKVMMLFRPRFIHFAGHHAF
ncbi:Uncharacterised protein [Vibrio cholerae]|nr:Uncharacterised protein [Vibrio cholerae]